MKPWVLSVDHLLLINSPLIRIRVRHWEVFPDEGIFASHSEYPDWIVTFGKANLCCGWEYCHWLSDDRRQQQLQNSRLSSLCEGGWQCVCVCWPQSRRWEQWSDALPLLTGSDWIHQREEAGSELSTGANIREIAHQPEATPFLKPQGPLEEIQKKIGLEDQEKQTCEGGGVS